MPHSADELAPGTELLIERLGHLGDGIAIGPRGPIMVPLSAPGDRVAWDGAVWRVSSPGNGRQPPPCSHFGICGGCSLQHISEAAYRQAKHEWIVAALANQGIEALVEPLVPISPGSRRRAALTITRTTVGVGAGFLGRRSHDVTAIPECLILRPRIKAVLPAVAGLVGGHLKMGQDATATVTEIEAGLDVAVVSRGRCASLDTGEIAKAKAAGLIGFSWNGELLMRLGSPRVRMSGVEVEFPPGAFIQATAEAEAKLVDLVRAALKGALEIADLYAGIGTFTFALARGAKIAAYEGDNAAIEALAAAARRTSGLKPIVAERRDLAVRPLMPQELKRFDGIVLDPPRPGAEPQVRALARSAVPRIAYVSCHPASFARDARLLAEGGYALTRVTPVDQFLWSHHIELVGEFSQR